VSTSVAPRARVRVRPQAGRDEESERRGVCKTFLPWLLLLPRSRNAKLFIGCQCVRRAKIEKKQVG
jgi:hypothetical protein